MPAPDPAALNFLLTRRSRPAKTLTQDAPERDELDVMLTAAARTPDHGKLEPFRFLVIEDDARQRLSDAVRTGMVAEGAEADKIDKQAGSFLHGGAIITIICSPVISEKIPDWEQHLAAGASCLACLNAALATGWGANWLTGWAASSRAFMETELGLTPSEFVAGFIHLGRETIAPNDRPRPDLGRKTTWISE